MDELKKPYYQEMLKRGRLFPIIHNNKMKGFITYYIGNGDISKYVREDMWQVLDDEPLIGKNCYIDQLVTTKEKDNPNLTFIVWHNFKNYIQQKYPQVINFRHNRFKEFWNEPKVFQTRRNKCEENLETCKANCCKVITFLLKTNRTPQEENDIQLVLAHEGTHYYNKNGVEYIEVDSKCKFLTEENKCSIYDKRFDLCRRYNCEIKEEQNAKISGSGINR